MRGLGRVNYGNILNLSVMKCYKIVLKIKNLKNNYGFFIVVSITLLYLITLFIFIVYSYNKIKKEVCIIIFSLKFKANPIKKKKKIKEENKIKEINKNNQKKN